MSLNGTQMDQIGPNGLNGFKWAKINPNRLKWTQID